MTELTPQGVELLQALVEQAGPTVEVTDNKKLLTGLVNKMAADRAAGGLGVCPCKIPRGDATDKQNVCPCSTLQEMIEDKSQCKCGLFKTKSNNA